MLDLFFKKNSRQKILSFKSNFDFKVQKAILNEFEFLEFVFDQIRI